MLTVIHAHSVPAISLHQTSASTSNLSKGSSETLFDLKEIQSNGTTVFFSVFRTYKSNSNRIRVDSSIKRVSIVATSLRLIVDIG